MTLAGRTVVQENHGRDHGRAGGRRRLARAGGGFTVAEATARLLRAEGCDDVTFVISGEDGKADEDLACAHHVARQALDAAQVDAGDFVDRPSAPPPARTDDQLTPS